MKKIILFSLCSSALLLFSQIGVFACGCPRSTDKDITMAVTQDFDRATIVFSGRVVYAEFVPIIKKDASGKEVKAENFVIKFIVNGSWKGKQKKEIILSTSLFRYPSLGYGENSGCDYSFAVGKKYLVYAVSSENKLMANSCGGTKLIENAAEDVRELQKLKIARKKTLSS